MTLKEYFQTSINNPYLEEIIKKMFEIAGYDYSNVIYSPTWFSNYQWTKKQAEKHKEWFVNYLKNNKKARERILSIPMISSIKLLKKAWDQFNFLYGLKEKG